MIRFAFALLVGLASVSNAAETPVPASEPNKTGYPSVAAAFDALKAKPGTKVTAGLARSFQALNEQVKRSLSEGK